VTVRLDLYLRAVMKAGHKKAKKTDGSAAEAALAALVRLLARQAAREWSEDSREAELRRSPSSRPESQR
jgi:hypothetical protein